MVSLTAREPNKELVEADLWAKTHQNVGMTRASISFT